MALVVPEHGNKRRKRAKVAMLSGRTIAFWLSVVNIGVLMTALISNLTQAFETGFDNELWNWPCKERSGRVGKGKRDWVIDHEIV